MPTVVDTDDFLAHYGVKGMKWGKRKADRDGVSARTDRDARKDANEFARAKMFYGDGAGTRRKLIKATVEAKSKKDPDYAKAFERHLNSQDLGKRASQARSERKRKDTTATVGKTARGVHRLATGGFGQTTLAAGVIFGSYMAAKKFGLDTMAMNAGKDIIGDMKARKSAKIGAEWLKNNGF